MILKFKCDGCKEKFDTQPIINLNEDSLSYKYFCFNCSVLEQKKEIEKKYLSNKMHFKSLIEANEKERDQALKSLIKNEA